MDPGTNRVIRAASEKTRRSSQHLLQQHGDVHQQQDRWQREHHLRHQGAAAESGQEPGESVLHDAAGEGGQGGGGGVLGVQTVRHLLRLLLLQLLVMDPCHSLCNVWLLRYLIIETVFLTADSIHNCPFNSFLCRRCYCWSSYPEKWIFEWIRNHFTWWSKLLLWWLWDLHRNKLHWWQV